MDQAAQAFELVEKFRAQWETTLSTSRGECSTGSAAADAAAMRELITAAEYPAPYPLSMLTTEMPGEQLLSIPSSAANPPKLAPYPTLVGTAITGAATRPATTLGSAPSIPATTITTLAFRSCGRQASRRCNPATPTSYNFCGL